MAYKDKVIHNKVTGFRIRFVQTSRDTQGKLLEMEATYPGHSKEPPAHFHPYQKEKFTILEGQLNVRVGGSVSTYKKGDEIIISANTIHSMWNGSDDTALVNWKVEPARDTEHMMEVFAGLANDGKTNASGVPGLLYSALLIRQYIDTFRLPQPSFIVQKVIVWPLATLAGWLGCWTTCKRYID